ncbi:hypothetical protein A3C20_03100 [Candidatus Kaiserbacteria bacterium RIFCSPHIGHO2_02_FULL_55_25]|uniref:site-specific DNA-methyltransferase (adenine-specific) n=1 Tax=Candidatus Kaiserbacteria bacterium RIFCSPHIGHO2_02_FULL_55_25 TaxID=1798498 RepID=A0A1F6E7T1_9BACT|nr:MAG: hypothetical protein A3C20_03100 [Candidatus Kaiserbacteria bacterium RIFCSPHIGHO2_02_FULL_55_25]
MAVSWSNIQTEVEKAVLKYLDAKDEDRDAKSFWKDVMTCYGVEARSVGAFEERVKVYGRSGVAKIDYFAPRKFLIEHKSRGKDLDDAYRQALDYFDALSDDIKPQYIIVSDFARIRVYDLLAKGEEKMTEFALEDFPQRIRSLAFFAEEEVREYKPEEHIDVRAVRVIGKLHDALKVSNYKPEHLPRLLTRLVFCFFADDIGIFEKNAMRRYLEEHTKSDGGDIGNKLSNIFDVLDTPDGTAGSENVRQAGMDDTLKSLPWVNGGMFAGHIDVVFGTKEIRDMLLKCMEFDWAYVSPAIFGSMFQSVMNEKERHDLGAHYTSETNILKVINGLFLEELKAELEVAATNKERLNALWDKIAAITLLDPACGCGNFLVVAYRELRAIENEIIRRIHGREDKRSAAHAASHGRLDLGDVKLETISRLSVERMYGIEIDSFPAEIAKLSLWLIDHKMNMELGKIFGKPFKKLPLTEAPHIVQGNALRLDWESVVPKNKLTHILGNPPFLGHHLQSHEQKEELENTLHNLPSVGVMDYVSAWYVKAAEYIQGTQIRCAFVSTNSISQGEQVGILWGDLLFPLGMKIQFAHRTFRWSNEATGKAAVYCVIIGFGLESKKRPVLYEYADIRGDAREVFAKNINPYLVDAADVIVRNRRVPMCDVPAMQYGSKPTDGGNLILSDEEKGDLLRKEPAAEKYVRRFLGADDFLNSEKRWCIWLVDAKPDELRRLPEIMRHVELVRVFRSISKAAATRDYPHPTLFRQITQPDKDFILVPRHSSENRRYIPFGLFSQDNIVADSCMAVGGATLYHFGVLESEMHMSWMRAVCGRLESRYRYSKDIVYNNFPWPETPTEAQKKAVADAAQEVLDVRKKYPTATLADLYDPNTMPTDLLKAHKTLDKAVDVCYGIKGFKGEPERLEFLFEQYKELTITKVV